MIRSHDKQQDFVTWFQNWNWKYDNAELRITL